MHNHHSGQELPLKEGEQVVLVGNPNVGKSAIFGLLTGKYVTVANYPGTTVEITRGVAHLNKKRYQVIDTPGVNNLLPLSEDERVTRDILLMEDSHRIVQVADSKNLRRSLLISLQLAEMELPFMLDLNMEDEARSRGIQIDTERLAQILGVEIISTVATRRKGLDRLVNGLSHLRSSPLRIDYGEPIESALRQVETLLPRAYISRRALGLMLLAGDESLKGWLHQNLSAEAIEKIEAIRLALQEKFPHPLSYVLTESRLRWADSILSQVMAEERVDRASWGTTLGQWSTHPIWGIPILLTILYLTYQFVGVFGAGTLVDFFEETLFGHYVNPAAIRLVKATLPLPFLQDLLVGDYGLITMALTYAIAIVFPIVGTFFVVFGLMEDSGYLPRLAVMSNQIFKVMGLNGKAVLPMVLGLGCDTMAVLTTRILESSKERLIVILLLALGVPCSAQLGVILGMLGGVSLTATLLWAASVVGVIVLVGFLAAQILPGQGSDFILELPPLRWPQLSNIVIKTAARIEWYLKEAVPLFALGTLFLFLLNWFGLLQTIEEAASPVISGLLGLPPKATAAFIVGFLRRDYGAAGLYALAKQGQLDPIQVVVSLVTITLFVPCIANFFMIVKEKGLKVALAMAGFIFPFAILVGGILNWVLRWMQVQI
ncbi:MAG: ferrous iron transport protein B [Candidatus Tectomicrobia bacterium]|uniref:Ferrous iron transport protein B n=1 Tax=Tectimicrobiota bacterium TaxID=2528274 RepID=A0A932CLT4_UNCTE|nr:ferrous iron transport protein B [Candidatus Tectomicrobia bacterium]